MKFKVGDRVAYNNQFTGRQCGVIERIPSQHGSEYVDVKFDEGCKQISGGYYPVSLTIIEPEKPQPKVGEFVIWMGAFHRVVEVDTITRISVEDGKGQLFAIEAADVEPIRDAA